GKYLSQIFSVFASTFTIVFYIIIGIILSFYLLSDYRGIMNLVRKRFNTSGLEYTIGILGRYIRIQLLSATIVGLLVYFLCLIFSINYANVIAIVAGFFNLIPNIGFAITVIISVIITLASSGNVLFDLFKLAIVFLIDSLVETTILTPKIMGNTFKIEPTLIIVSFTISTALLGIFGFFLAVPLAVLIKNFIFNEGQVPPRF
ncbi:MAG: AI-2E family transporter, partial [candidate division WOR-3 bacterium]|nr:AI-2E family transporter [candidate division WOR-3 bacterium]